VHHVQSNLVNLSYTLVQKGLFEQDTDF
jgi:hypothetical protein